MHVGWRGSLSADVVAFREGTLWRRKKAELEKIGVRYQQKKKQVKQTEQRTANKRNAGKLDMGYLDFQRASRGSSSRGLGVIYT